MNEKELSKNIERLSKVIERRTKWWNVFLNGVLTGIGTVIGAALIGSLLVGVISSNLNKIPILKNIIPAESIEQIIEEE